MDKQDRVKIARAIIAFILSSLGTMAYIYFTRLGINYPVPKFSSLMGFTLADCIVLGLGTVAYYKFLSSKPKIDYLLIFISLVLGLCALMLGDIYRYGGANVASHVFVAPLLYIASFIGFFLAIYASLYYLLYVLKHNINKNKILKNINPFLLALCIFAVWLIGYIIFFYPGALRWEAGLVIGFIEGSFLPRKVAPAFYQLFISVFYNIGKLFNSDSFGLVLYFVFVGYISALAQARLIVRAIKLNISVYIVCVFVALTAFNPLVFMQTFLMSYDTLLAISMLYFAIELYDVVHEEYSLKHAAKLFFASFAVCAFRNVGFALLIASILASAIYFIKRFKTKGIVLIVSMTAAAILFYFGNNLAFNIMGIEREEKLGNASIALYQMGYTLNKYGAEALTDIEKATLEPYVDVEAIGSNYYQNVSDSVKYQFLYHDNPYEKNMKDGGEQAFMSVWKSLGKRYPKDYAIAFVKSCYKFVIPGFFEETNDWGRWQHAPMHIDGIERIKSYKPYIRSAANVEFNESCALFKGYTTIYGAFMSSGYIFMSIIISALLIIRKKTNILPLIPAVLYCFGMLFSPVNGWLRYAVPAGFAVPLCILLLLSSYKGAANE